MTASIALRNAARVGGRRSLSTAAPKQHKAKDMWATLEATRPPAGHAHTVFHPPYSTPVVAGGVITVICTGYGMMYFGMRHQQYKQGYWK